MDHKESTQINIKKKILKHASRQHEPTLRQAAGEQEAQANLIVFWHCVHKASVNTHHNAKGAKTTP